MFSVWYDLHLPSNKVREECSLAPGKERRFWSKSRRLSYLPVWEYLEASCKGTGRYTGGERRNDQHPKKEASPSGYIHPKMGPSTCLERSLHHIHPLHLDRWHYSLVLSPFFMERTRLGLASLALAFKLTISTCMIDFLARGNALFPDECYIPRNVNNQLIYPLYPSARLGRCKVLKLPRSIPAQGETPSLG